MNEHDRFPDEPRSDDRDDYPRNHDDRDDDDRDYGEREELPQSGVGVASFVMGLLASFLVVALICVAGYLQVSRPGRAVDKNETMFLGLAIIGGGFVAFVGLVIGIVGLAQPRRRKVIAALGVVINALVVLGIFGLMIIGLAMKDGAGVKH